MISAEMAKTIGLEMVNGSIDIVIGLARVIIPLMMVMEVMLRYKLIERGAAKLKKLASLIGIEANNIFPLIVGVVIGITYGAGTIMEIQEEREISKKDVFLMGVFIFACHGLIESAVIFTAIGANLFIMVVGRLIIATVVTAVIARTIAKRFDVKKHNLESLSKGE